MNPQIYTRWNRPDKVYETMDDREKLVEPEHAISVEKRVTALLNAGQRLEASRANAYHFQNKDNSDNVEVDTTFIDPTQDPAFDEIDAQILAQEVGENLNDSLNNINDDNASETVPETAPDPSGDVLDDEPTQTPPE